MTFRMRLHLLLMGRRPEMKVKNVFQTITKGPDIIRENDSIQEVLLKISKDLKTRSVFVINEEEELVGIINVRDLLRVAGAKHLQRDTRMVIPYLTANRATDIMQPPFFVSPEDEIDDALRLAVTHDLKDIPVVERGKIVGDLNCFEILLNVNFE